MAKKLKKSHLLTISKSTSSTLKTYKYGAFLTRESEQSIDQLVEDAARHRHKLAQQFLKNASRVINANEPQYRIGLGRAYYAMYHAARATVYFMTQGDDHEEHSVLPRHLPNDFPDRNRWENEIKTARLERNRADYDPYPNQDKAFTQSAKATLSSADDFVKATKKYLTRKGCKA